ncbi:MAG: TonB-dependent receptor [Bacteroidia bacterium]|nr:TonB-dependent receptor [Bacteroidia bacterium]
MKAIILKFCFATFLILQTGIINAATNFNTIKGKVTDEKNQPVEFATAALISPKTQEIVKGEVCNEKGEFIIPKIEKGEYILSVSMVGYERIETEKVLVDGRHEVIEKNIVLRENTETLNELVVVGNKNFIEQTVDKMVINPEASATAGSENVFEILKKLPGVNVDNSDNITLKGMTGVKVLIDDKPTYLSSSQLAAMLKGMQGKNVDRIEIIENPSARYDAEGNSGIINIKTKHVKAPGFNGNVNVGATQANRFGWNGGVDLNMNYGKLNLYGNYSNYNWSGINGLEGTRRFTSPEMDGALQIISNQGNYTGSSHNYKFGADYYLAKNHVLSAMFRGNTGSNDITDDSRTTFADKFRNADSTLITTSVSGNHWKNGTYNLNYKWDIDSLGQNLSFDVDYANFRFNSGADQDGNYYNAQNQPLNNSINVNTNQGNDIYILTSKLDYILPLNKKYNFEAGLKASYVKTDNYIDMNGYLTQSDNFLYEENIQAAYVNGRAQFDKTTLQLGLRLENTISKGTSVATNHVNDTSYLKLFPSFFVQQQLNDNHNLNFKYSYRIGRPSYHNLNPFKWMVDPYTYNVGNPYLKPQFTHSLGLTHSYKGMFITTVGMNYTKNLFTDVLEQDDEARALYQTVKNLHNAMDLNISETFQLKPTKWWNLNGTVTAMYKTVVLDANSDDMLQRPGLMANLTNNFELPWKINMELSGRYMSGILVSNLITHPRYYADLGFQRKVFGDKGSVKLSFSDIFNTNKGGGYVKYKNTDITVLNTWDAQRVSLTFNYRFGNDNIKTRANRSTSSGEEQSRSSK